MRLAGIGLLLCVAVQAQVPASGPGRMLTFTLDRTGASASHYSVALDESTGKGVYLGTAAAGVSSATGAPAETGQPIAVRAAVVAKVFAAVPLVKSNRCDSHRKGIAQTGVKTLRLVGADATAECSYNYSEDDRVNAATNVFQAIAATMQYGESLRSKLRFDRLGLDAEMDGLQAALKDERALEVGNIAAVLQAIGNDDRVMERVRRKAALLLESAGVVPAAAGPG